MHPTQAIEIFGNVSMPFGTLAISDLSVKILYEDRPKGTPPSGVNRKRGSQHIAILDMLKSISRKRWKMGGKLILFTNRKLRMSFRSVPNSVTLDDLERRNFPNYSPNRSVISPNSVAFRTDYVKVREDALTAAEK